jgi:pimeloyl-ACP methyl ester carboxylesterase
MTQYSHQTAPTQFVDTAGVRFACRRFGKSGGVPLVFNIHFTGTMDHWDPAVTDGFAKDREVILFDNTGISSSSGEVPTSIEEMAADAAAFVKALGLTEVDVLGFSLGGLIAQTLAIAEPKLVRRVVLVGTGPRSGEGMATLTPEAQEIFGATPPMRSRTIFGCACTSRPRSGARPPAAISSSGSGCGARVAIRRSAKRLLRHSSKHSGNGARRATIRTSI